MEKKEGKHLCNARVDIDYSSGKPKIKFKYPGKNPNVDAINQGGIIYIALIIWVLIGIIPFAIHSINSSSTVDFPSQCGNFSLDELHYNISIVIMGDISYNNQSSFGSVYGFNVTCDNATHVLRWNPNKESGKPPKFYEDAGSRDTESMAIYLAWIIWAHLSLIISAVINKHLVTRFLVKKKWYQKWLPKANADGMLFKKKVKKYCKYRPRDMTGNVIVIPRFSNVELDYITAGDFGSKLKSITIREYKERTINIKTKKKSKEKVEHFKWYAVFEFTSKPKNGFLEVIYQ